MDRGQPRRRPRLLAAALFVVVLVVPVSCNYFGLTAPDPDSDLHRRPAVLLWLVSLSLVLRFGVLERILGRSAITPDYTTRPLTPSSQDHS